MRLPFAYIDPGTGSLIIQFVIAGLVAVPIFFRTQIMRGARAVRRMAGRSTPDSAPHADDAGRSD